MLKYKKTKKTQENQVILTINISNQMLDLFINKEQKKLTWTKHLSLSQLKNHKELPTNSLLSVRSLVASGCANDAFEPSLTDAITVLSAIKVF